MAVRRELVLTSNKSGFKLENLIVTRKEKSYSLNCTT